jgi:glyoxylate/hydroxypyruvate reductase A
MPDVILITSWLEPEQVERIRSAAPWAEIVYEPALLRPPRYLADHAGRDVTRTAEQEAQWRTHLRRATILFDFDRTHLEDLPDVAPDVRWVQATSAGIGRLVGRLRYADRMPDTTFTTASGVHARPLSEWVLMCLLGHVRGLLHTVEAQRSRTWERYAGTDLEGRSVLVAGYGRIGQAIGRTGRAFGLRVIGVRRDPGKPSPHADAVHGPDDLSHLLEESDFLVLAAPHTEETESMIGAEELARLPAHAALVNVGRGSLVDEPALIEALRAGSIAAAYLDVFATEPLPHGSPLWTMPNVLVSPHSASTSDRENARLTNLFIDNLGRWNDGRPLRNVLDTSTGY